MRKMRKIFPILLIAVFASCIKPEAANSEADIIAVTLPDGYTGRATEIFNDSIAIHLSNNVYFKFLAPEFKLTPGATILPESGTIRSFYSTVYYEVTSENGQWTKRYAVTADWAAAPDENTAYEFENVKMDNLERYQIFYEKNDEGQEKFSWASGNSGYALTGAASSYQEYPLYQSDNGVSGKCACLTTCTTGTFGPMVGMPLAAGSLFIGSFDLATAVTAPLKATHFGMQWDAVPVKMTGKFKYTPGSEFYVKDASAPGGKRLDPTRHDKCNIYAVFFESTKEMPYLDGENSLSENNPNIISTAVLPEKDALGSTDWKEFSLEFVAREGKTVDAVKMKEGKYSLAIVMTSSADGNKFEGAVGSCLLVDNIHIYSNVK